MRVLHAGLALVLLVAATSTAPAADRFVSTAGVDTGSCDVGTSPCQSVRFAVEQAASGDTIKVAGGTYVERVAVLASTTLAISGGWSADFSSRDPVLNPTRLRGMSNGPYRTAPLIGALADSGESIVLSVDGLVLFRAAYGLETGAGGGGQVDVTVADCVFTKIGNSGILVHVYGAGARANVSVESSTFKRNRGYDGGGVEATAGNDAVANVQLVDSTFEANRANSAAAGGAVGVRALDATGTTTLDVDGCVFNRNVNRSREPFGAGAGGVSGVGGSVTIADSVFSKNRCTVVGGAVSVFQGSLAVTNSAFVGNRSASGRGAAYIYGSPASITNSTFFGNVSPQAPGVEVVLGTLVLRNSVLWHSGTPAIGGATIDADHNNIESGTFNDLGGNISTDPLLDADRIHLLAGSPCVDTGTCGGAPATDFEGDARPTGGGCDMGADERAP